MASDENVGFGSGARVNVNEVMSESTLPNTEESHEQKSE
jgi:hypothetical protein